jgi:hypothetical protein
MAVKTFHAAQNRPAVPLRHVGAAHGSVVCLELIIKALDWIKKSSDVPKRLRLALWDSEKMEALIVELSVF